jgi:hypothetical protein
MRMTNTREPLTPAEQMRQIREAIETGGNETAWEARAELAAIALQLESLREYLRDSDHGGSSPAGSFAPGSSGGVLWSKRLHMVRSWLAGRRFARYLAGRLRAVRNWVALNILMPALAVQQNQFNARTMQTLAGVLDALEAMLRLVQDVYREVGRLEAQAASLPGQDPPNSCTSR